MTMAKTQNDYLTLLDALDAEFKHKLVSLLFYKEKATTVSTLSEKFIFHQF